MLRLMKDLRIGIVDLARVSGIYEGVILEILADVCEADIDTLCRFADALGVEVYELRPDEERYAVMVEKNALAKLIPSCFRTGEKDGKEDCKERGGMDKVP